MGSEGFEPTKAEPADLQSVPFDHSGNSPTLKPTQGFEPWTPRLQITCSRPAELNWRSERYEYYMKYNFMSTPKVKKNDFFSLFYKKFIKIFTKQQKNNSAKKKELPIPLDSSF